MAVDTRDKRFSMIGLGSSSPSILPNPDGTIGAADRAMLLWLYAGIALQTTSIEVVSGTILSYEGTGTIESYEGVGTILSYEGTGTITSEV